MHKGVFVLSGVGEIGYPYCKQLILTSTSQYKQN